MNIIRQMKPKASQNFSTIFLSSIGGVLEFYDFVIFILLSKFISQNFLTGSDYSRLIGTYGIFALGSLVRPASGLILGHLGDKYGRKLIFLFSIFVMALATMSIGLLPSYKTIGMAAPVCLVVVRIIQGISLGGEVPGAITFVYEHMPSGRKVFGVAILLGGIGLGVASASFVMSLLSICFPEKTISEWAWRLPFIIGGIGGLLGFIMRFKLQETPDFLALSAQKRILRMPVMEVIRNYKCNSLVGMTLIISVGIVLIYFCDFLAPYLQTELHYTVAGSINLSLLFCFTEIILIITFGYISIRVSLKSEHSILLKLTVINMFLVMLAICNLILLSPSGVLAVLLIITSAVTTAIYLVTMILIMDFFPTEIRYTGMAMTYNIGFGIAEAATPVVFTWAIHYFNSQFASIYCFAAIFAIGIIAILSVPYCKKAEQDSRH